MPQKGDVNGDGKIDSVDALIVNQYYVGLTTLEYPIVADVNDDGSIDVVDALMIAQYSSGLLPEL
jgi:hypothetical protein